MLLPPSQYKPVNQRFFYKILAIIPARAGSKRLPRKNMSILGGKPLIDYSIKAAKECQLVSQLAVSTEDVTIKKHVLSQGIQVIDRPAFLAEDDVSNDQVVMHAICFLEMQGQQFDTIVLLQPTSPLRTAQHLTECLSKFITGTWESAMSICKIDQHPAKTIVINNNKIEPFLDDHGIEEQSQKLSEVYCQNGAIYVTRLKIFKEKKKFFQRPCMPYIMKREDSIDIDNEFDLQLAAFRLAHERHYV